jgi:hypothetical protein
MASKKDSETTATGTKKAIANGYNTAQIKLAKH